MEQLSVKTAEMSSCFKIKTVDISAKSPTQETAPNSDEYSFISMSEQRFFSKDRPLTLLSPVIQETAPIFDNETCKRLFTHFNNRHILLASTGKQKDGSFSPFVRIHSDKNKHWGTAFIEHTHFTFTLKFTDDFNQTSEAYPVLIVDIDDFDGDYSVFAKYDLIPNYLVRNPKKTKSLQVGYVLSSMVFKLESKHFYDYEKRDKSGKPLPLHQQSEQVKFSETVSRLNALFNGDVHFKLHNAKNPFFATEVGAVAWTELPPYSIHTLFSKAFNAYEKANNYDDEVDFSDIENHILTETVPNEHYQYDKNSRNCQLFDEMRLLAYELSAEYVETKATKEFFAYLMNIAIHKNQEYLLPKNEVKATIRSIVKYCFKNEVACKYPDFKKRRLEKMSKIKTYMLDTYGVNHKYSKTDKEFLAEKFNVSERSVTTYISQVRKENGYKVNDKTELLNRIGALRNTIPPTKWRIIAEMLNMTEDNVKKIYKRGTKEQ